MTLLSPLDDLQDVLNECPTMGIDPSTSKVAVSVLIGGRETNERAVAQHSEHVRLAKSGVGLRSLVYMCPKIKPEDRDFRWYGRVADGLFLFFEDVFAAYGYPVMTLLEEPFASNQIHYSSLYVVGCVQVALAQALGEQGVVDTCAPSEWKLPALGQGLGNAKKPRILRWAREEMGLDVECRKCGTGSDDKSLSCKEYDISHDRADSAGLAVAAARRAARAR